MIIIKAQTLGQPANVAPVQPLKQPLQGVQNPKIQQEVNDYTSLITLLNTFRNNQLVPMITRLKTSNPEIGNGLETWNNIQIVNLINQISQAQQRFIQKSTQNSG